jgi:hypothetical protein
MNARVGHIHRQVTPAFPVVFDQVAGCVKAKAPFIVAGLDCPRSDDFQVLLRDEKSTKILELARIAALVSNLESLERVAYSLDIRCIHDPTSFRFHYIKISQIALIGKRVEMLKPGVQAVRCAFCAFSASAAPPIVR